MTWSIDPSNPDPDPELSTPSIARYDEHGQKQRYFADDDNVDLATLVRRAKYGDDEHDLDHAVAGSIAKKARYDHQQPSEHLYI